MKKRVLIVGGVAGGANAATRLRRLDETLEIVVFERGPYVSFANCGLPYHIGGEINDRQKLLQHTPETLRDRFAVDVRVGHSVDRIDRGAKEIEVMEKSCSCFVNRVSVHTTPAGSLCSMVSPAET